MKKIQIYSLDISTVPEDEIHLWYAQMSEAKKASVDRILSKEKQLSKIAADALCRKAISNECGIPCSEIIFGTVKNGKPFAVNAQINFNVSHSGNIVVCAVADREIGIDIEKIRNVNPKTVQRFATENEIELIKKVPDGFFKIWTLKEAYFKCIGTGLGSDIKNVSFDISDERIICSETGFDFAFKNIADGYICSVCIKN